MASWVDSHCHLDFPAFDRDRDAVLARARGAGVTDIVVPATRAEGWENILKLAEGPGLHAALGLHPWWAGEHRPEQLQALEAHLGAGHVVAIGECGLDYARDIDRGTQLDGFRAQLRLAAAYGLPVIVHAVRTIDQVLHELAAFDGIRGVIHGFAGSSQQAGRCVSMGLMLGIGPAVARSEKLAAVVREIPVENLLLETDAPDRPLRGERGEPMDVAAVGGIVAGIRQMEEGALAAATSANARSLFAFGRAIGGKA